MNHIGLFEGIGIKLTLNQMDYNSSGQLMRDTLGRVSKSTK